MQVRSAMGSRAGGGEQNRPATGGPSAGHRASSKPQEEAPASRSVHRRPALAPASSSEQAACQRAAHSRVHLASSSSASAMADRPHAMASPKRGSKRSCQGDLDGLGPSCGPTPRTYSDLEQATPAASEAQRPARRSPAPRARHCSVPRLVTPQRQKTSPLHFSHRGARVAHRQRAAGAPDLCSEAHAPAGQEFSQLLLGLQTSTQHICDVIPYSSDALMESYSTQLQSIKWQASPASIRSRKRAVCKVEGPSSVAEGVPHRVRLERLARSGGSIWWGTVQAPGVPTVDARLGLAAARTRWPISWVACGRKRPRVGLLGNRARELSCRNARVDGDRRERPRRGRAGRVLGRWAGRASRSLLCLPQRRLGGGGGFTVFRLSGGQGRVLVVRFFSGVRILRPSSAPPRCFGSPARNRYVASRAGSAGDAMRPRWRRVRTRSVARHSLAVGAPPAPTVVGATARPLGLALLRASRCVSAHDMVNVAVKEGWAFWEKLCSRALLADIVCSQNDAQRQERAQKASRE